MRHVVLVSVGLATFALPAFADCPVAADMADGIVLETRDGENRFHARLLEDNNVWVAISKGGLPLSADTLSFERKIDHGLLVTSAPSNWPSWTVTDDLSVIATMEVGDTVEINGTVAGDRHAGGDAGLATFRLQGREDITLGNCTYSALAFGAKAEFTKPDGTIDTMPGYFKYVPELQIAFAGMWDGGLRNVTGIRKGTQNDWFGD